MSSSSFLGGYNPGNLTTKGGLGSGIGYQFGQNEQQIAGTNANRSAESGSTIPGYQSLIDSGGYSDAEKSQINQSTLGSINNSYNSAAGASSRKAAITGNAAGQNSFLGSLARSKAQSLSSQSLANQSQFANEAYTRKLAGLQGLSQMYGVDTSFLSSLGQQQNSLLNTGQSVQSGRRGVLGDISAGLSTFTGGIL